VALAGLAATLAVGGWLSTRGETAAQIPTALPASAAPALRVGRPTLLSANPHLARWTTVVEDVIARRAPTPTAPAVATLATRTPEGTANVLAVLGRARDAHGKLWVRVGLPVLPNNTAGWVPRSALGGYGVVATHLVVDLAQLTATLYRDGTRVFQAPVGVGRGSWPTPTGSFIVRSRLTSYRSPFYGPLAFGTTARSAVLTDWPAGGFVGIHGTNEPRILPGRVSHGCIRLRNHDLLRLARLMPVGTPVTIR
jgi:hypothetical protein